MSMLITLIVVLVVLALLLHAVSLFIDAGPTQRLIKAALIVFAVLLIAQRAGLLP